MRLLFDDLVGAGEDRWRHCKAERLRGLEVDDQLEPGWLLDRKIGRLGALEDLSGVNSSLAPGIGEAWSVADQAAGRGEFPSLVNRWNGIPRRQRHELLAPACEERIGADDKRAGLQLDEGCETGVDFALGAGIQDLELQPLARAPSSVSRFTRWAPALFGLMSREITLTWRSV